MTPPTRFVDCLTEIEAKGLISATNIPGQLNWCVGVVMTTPYEGLCKK